MSIYYDEIHRRANEEWKGLRNTSNYTPLITSDNFEEWKRHWLITAGNWAEECKNQGLMSTYKHILDIIRNQQ